MFLKNCQSCDKTDKTYNTFQTQLENWVLDSNLISMTLQNIQQFHNITWNCILEHKEGLILEKKNIFLVFDTIRLMPYPQICQMQIFFLSKTRCS